MSDILQLIKRCAVEAVAAQKPTELVFGVVTQEEDIREEIPLQITLQQKAVIERDFLFDTMATYGLREGEKLLLLRQSGGDRYLLLDKLRESDENAT